MSHNFHIPSGASVPAITGEYAYYVPSLMGTSGMIHYWNISTPDKHSAFCHFSYPSPNLSLRGVRLVGRIINMRKQLASY